MIFFISICFKEHFPLCLNWFNHRKLKIWTIFNERIISAIFNASFCKYNFQSEFDFRYYFVEIQKNSHDILLHEVSFNFIREFRLIYLAISIKISRTFLRWFEIDFWILLREMNISTILQMWLMIRYREWCHRSAFLVVNWIDVAFKMMLLCESILVDLAFERLLSNMSQSVGF